MVPNTLGGIGLVSGLGNIKTEVIYTIGQTGPGGGKVIYDAGSVQSWGRYIEMAASTTSPTWTIPDTTYQWSGNTTTLVSGLSEAIGAGFNNTSLIIAQSSTSGRAATVCRAYTGGGFTNWSLPSVQEMQAAWTNRVTASLNLTGGAFYWTSSGTNSSNSFVVFMNDGAKYLDPKSTSRQVRPIRYFS